MPGLWELLTNSKPDRNLFSFQDKQAYKQCSYNLILIELIIVPRVKSKQTKFLNISGLFRNCSLTQGKCLGNRYNNNNVFGQGLLQSQTCSRVWVSSKPSKGQ